MKLPVIRLTQKEFEDLPNYSCSVPTRFTPGQTWRRAKRYHDQDLSDSSKWHVLVDMEVDGKAIARCHEIHILDESETLIRDRLYASK